ncbi:MULTISPECIES: AAA family ATPase [unclassified Agarivorans]|uniref:AAA family ATPase n=1 Tax=unclassified Agarivorans TaxID=2636026 RepID=UPI0026E244CF|nr:MULTISPECIES: AAA family ATPase [unclassified Agarivorans]MDO6686597.1 AAA family ATPase [Agarivorans sp. 3_MG-2023]MDO6715415.1 AAA family ATPase [Agarivorans sp. 2_MG-2023]
MKRLILVTSPPASGKTYISKQLAKALKHVVYLDKDTLIVLSHQIFKLANVEVNRSSDFFEEHIRNYEYQATLALAMEALDYDDIVLINAPFTREIRDTAYIDELKKQLVEKNARLTVVWVETDVDVVKQRMIDRNSSRDTWKLENWDEYIKGVDSSVPHCIDNPEVVDDLLLFKNSNQQQYQQSMQDILKMLETK